MGAHIDDCCKNHAAGDSALAQGSDGKVVRRSPTLKVGLTGLISDGFGIWSYRWRGVKGDPKILGHSKGRVSWLRIEIGGGRRGRLDFG